MKEIKKMMWTPRLPSVSLILGFRGNGKSVAGFYYADKSAKKYKMKKYIFGVNDEGHLPDDWGYLNDLDFPRDSIILVDELSIVAYARRAMSKPNQVMDYITAMSRKKNQIIFYITHHSRKVDVNLVTDIDYLFYKKPSKLHIKMDRPAIKPFASKAYEILKMNGKSSSYVFDFVTDKEFLISNPLPRYWSDDISNMISVSNVDNIVMNENYKVNSEGWIKKYIAITEKMKTEILNDMLKKHSKKFTVDTSKLHNNIKSIEKLIEIYSS